MLFLNAYQVQQSLSMQEAIVAMKDAMSALSSGKANIPERIHLESRCGTTLVMPGNVDDGQQSALVVKVVSIFNENSRKNLPNILGIVSVLDPMTGAPLAIMDGAAITAIRTAATSAAATDLLAKKDASTLAIIGSGAQARSHFRAIQCVRSIKRCFFYSPRAERVAAMIGELTEDVSMEKEVELFAAQSSAEATAEAEIICTTTNSSTSVIEDSAVRDGCHINAIGSYKPSVVEIPAATVIRSRVIVDQLQHALQEAGDLIQPIKAGLFSAEQITGELGQLVLGKVSGRKDDNEVTLFKSVGNTVQDTFAAQLAYENAANGGLGTSVDF